MNDDMNMTTYDDEVEQEEMLDQLRDMLRDEDERRADDARQLEEQEQDEQQVEDEEEAYPDFVDSERLRDEGATEEEIERLREEEEANYWGLIQDNKAMIYEKIADEKVMTPEDQEVLEQWQQEEENFKQYQLQKQEEQDSWFDSPIEDENNEEIEVEEVEQ